uniref:G-protein coupled receptor 84-like n=1 Tax=Phallusia mammillata TaxID=59560 RepID=A0A6F9DEL4_9ASCI|nr:G-protein coupled receptor 84-like [Phallusia mammillata]
MTTSVEQFRYLGICLGSVVCIVGTIGNLMTILAYATNPRMRTAFNMLIVSLAVIDLGLSAFILPFIIYGYSTNSWPFSDKSCEVFAFFYYALHYTSSVNLLTISFNRYMHVSRPRTAYRIIFSKHKRRVAAVLMWSFAPLSLLPLIFTGGFGWWESGLMCAFTRSPGFADTYSLVMRVLFQFVPLFGMVVLYGLIFHTVKRSHANIDNRKSQAESNDSASQSNEITKSAGISSPGRRACERSPGYQLRLSYSPTTPTTVNKTPIQTPEQRRIWRQYSNQPNAMEPIVSTTCFENITGTDVLKKASPTDSSSQNKTSILRHQSVSIKHAKICRAATTGDLIEEKSTEVGTTSTKQPNSIKTRSVTFSNFECTKNKSNNHVLEDKSNTDDSKTHIGLQRPRSLTLKTLKPPQESVTNLKRSSSYAPRSLKRTLSASLNSLTPNRMRQRINSAISNVKSKETIVRRTSVHHAKAQRQLLYMSTVICATFAFCALPSLILNLVGNYNFIEPEFFMAASNLGWLTSMINPIVYAAMNVQFRKEYTRVMKKFSNCVWPRHSKVYPVKGSMNKKENCTA